MKDQDELRTPLSSHRNPCRVPRQLIHAQRHAEGAQDQLDHKGSRAGKSKPTKVKKPSIGRPPATGKKPPNKVYQEVFDPTTNKEIHLKDMPQRSKDVLTIEMKSMTEDKLRREIISMNHLHSSLVVFHMDGRGSNRTRLPLLLDEAHSREIEGIMLIPDEVGSSTASLIEYFAHSC